MMVQLLADGHPVAGIARAVDINPGVARYWLSKLSPDHYRARYKPVDFAAIAEAKRDRLSNPASRAKRDKTQAAYIKIISKNPGYRKRTRSLRKVRRNKNAKPSTYSGSQIVAMTEGPKKEAARRKFNRFMRPYNKRRNRKKLTPEERSIINSNNRKTGLEKLKT
jgi:hypothetical protein